MSLKGIDIQLRIFASKKSPPSSALGFGDVLECTAQVVCHVDVLFEFPPKTRIETDMLAGPMVETIESVKLYLSYKKGSKWSQPTTARCRERECREELNVGPECQSTTTSLLMTVNLSESGSFPRCSLLLAALLMALAVGLPARFHT